MFTKENVKSNNFLTQNLQEIRHIMKRISLRIIGIKEREDSWLYDPENIFKKIIELNFFNLKKKLPIRIQEAYKTNRLD